MWPPRYWSSWVRTWNTVRQKVIELRHGSSQGKKPTAEDMPVTSLVLDQFGRNLSQAAREGKL